MPPALLPVVLKLYDSGGSLKQDLGLWQLSGYDLFSTSNLAELVYSQP